jgi:ribosomal protein L39E
LRASGVVFLTQKVKLEKEEKQNSSVNLSVL